MTTELTTYTLDEVCEFTNGFAFKSKDYIPESDETIEVFRMGYIERGGGFKEDTTPVFVPREYGRDLSKFMLRPGDVTIAMTDMKNNVAILGNTARVTHADRFVLNQRVGCIRVSRPDVLDPRFLYYYSNSADHIQDLRSRANSGVQVNLSTAAIKESELHLPTLPEQRAIASILGSLDDKIELNRRMNATLESLARAIFKSWFVDFDPVHANAIRMNAGKINAGQMPSSSAIPTTHDPKVLDLFPTTFQDSELGPIPEGWSVKRLEDLTTEIGSGATPRGGSKVYVEQGVALVRSQNVFDYEFVWDGLARITDEAAKKLEKLTLQEGDVLFNITGASILRTCIVDPRVLPARVNQHVARIRADEGVSPYYLHEYLVRKEMKDQMIGLNAGATREAITKGHLQNLEIIAPSTSVLEAFDDVTQPLYRKKQEANAESFELGSLRDALLPQLLSGELPVPEAVFAAEEALA